MAETVLPGFEINTWFGLVAPAKTPREIIAKLNQAVVKGLLNAEMRERLLAQGIEPVGNSPAEFTQLMREELPKWGKIAKISGAKLDRSSAARYPRAKNKRRDSHHAPWFRFGSPAEATLKHRA